MVTVEEEKQEGTREEGTREVKTSGEEVNQLQIKRFTTSHSPRRS